MLKYGKRIYKMIEKYNNSKKDHSKKVYVPPSIQEIGLISKKTKTNAIANSNDNPSGAVLTKGS